MTAVQAHGEYYENQKTLEITGYSKIEYDAMKKSGYTSPMDIVEGLSSDFNASIKSIGKGNEICYSDARRMTTHSRFRSYVGVYKQVGDNKCFYEEYVFYFTPENISLLWASNDLSVVHEYAEKISSINYKSRDCVMEYRNTYKKVWLKELNWDKTALIKLRPKVSIEKPKTETKSKVSGQARLQCAMKLDDLIASGVECKRRDIDYTIYSPPRSFKKKSK